MSRRFLRPAVAQWRTLDPAAKFVAYNRWSLQAMVFLFAAGTAVGIRVPWVLACVVISAMLTVDSLHRQPSLRIGRAPERLWPIQVDYVFHLACFGLGVAGNYPHLAFLSVVALLLAYIPFLRHGTSWALIVRALGAAVFLGLAGNWLFALVSLTIAPLTPLILWTIGLMIDAHRARFLEAQLRVSEERHRFAQDLHDTLGQNLAAMSIKAQLAAKLAQRGDSRLGNELEQLRSLIDATVTDMRSVAGNYHTTDLTEEVATAVTVLREAGVDVNVMGGPETLTGHLSEVAAWFVREATTNVLRHSLATRVTLTIKPVLLSMTNDAPLPEVRSGSGLDNLRRRAAAVGGSVRIDRTPSSFTTTLELP